MGKVPTIKDVAREAGVAVGTVSKVVNHIPVREEYQIRVEKAIKKLDYQVNSYAQGMKSPKTHTIALLIPNTKEPYFAALSNEINLALLRRKYRMLLCCTESDISREQEYIKMVRRNKTDGMIAAACHTGIALEEGMRAVSVDCFLGSEIPCIASDHFAGGQLAAQKLADLGCKKVALLREGSAMDDEPGRRQAGFFNGCMMCGLHCETKTANEKEPYDEFLKFFTDRMRDGRMELDGIFCMSDGLAYLIVRILEGLGLKAPKDIQVIGFGGVSIFGDGNYLCSTIVQPVREIAEMCVELLLRDGWAEKLPLVCFPVAYACGGTTRS